jgi:hypothetical protein
MKTILAAALLVLAALPAHAGDACYTLEMVRADLMKMPAAKELTTLHAIDEGFEEPTDVTIWSDGKDHYLAVLFVQGCFVAHAVMDDEMVESFINDHTKRAEPKP